MGHLSYWIMHNTDEAENRKDMQSFPVSGLHHRDLDIVSESSHESLDVLYRGHTPPLL